MNTTLFIKAQSRPIRFAYLVSNPSDVLDAIKFYTHIWGGRASVILPMPNTNLQVRQCAHALLISKPDFLVIPDGQQTPYGRLMLAHSPIPQVIIGRGSNVDSIVANTTILQYHKRTFPTLSQVMPWQKYRAKSLTVANTDRINHRGIALQSGLPSKTYIEQIISNWQTCDIEYLNSPQNHKEYIQQSLVIRSRFTALDLTMLGLHKSLIGGAVFDGDMDADFLWLFLTRGNDISMESLYWNLSSFAGFNKYLVDRSSFLGNIEQQLTAIMDGTHREINIIRVVMAGTVKSASIVRDAIMSYCSTELKRDIEVDVFYSGWDYLINPEESRWKKPVVSTQVPRSDGMITIQTETPEGFENNSYAYAYTAEIHDDLGRKVSLPGTPEATRILTYGIPNIRHWFNFDDSAMASWFDWSHVHCNDSGMSGIASDRTNDDSRADTFMFIPHQRDFLQAYLYQHQFTVAANDPAHYARAVLRRLVPHDKFIEWSIDIDVLRSFIDIHNKPRELKHQALATLIKKLRHIEQVDANKLINESLPRLLRGGLIQRGAQVPCESCGFCGWYPISEIRERIECSGCGESTSIPLSLSFTFRPTELVADFFRSGGFGVARTVSFFAQMGKPGVVEIGGEVAKSTVKGNIADVDIFRLSNDEVALVECKDWKKIDSRQLSSLRSSCKKLIELGKQLRVDSVYLSITTDTKTSQFELLLKHLWQYAAKREITFRLILNGILYQYLKTSKGLKLDKLPPIGAHVSRNLPAKLKCVGQNHRSHGHSGIDDYYDREQIGAWKEQFRLNP